MFACTNTAVAETQVIRSVPFTIAQKIFKCFGISVAKDVQDLYNTNYKTSRKEREDTQSGKIFNFHEFSWIERNKRSLLPKAIYKFNAIEIIIQKAFF